MLYPGNTIKSLIIEYLSDKKFSNAKEISSVVKEYYKPIVTPQTIYNNLNSLLEEKILVKHNQQYIFSKEFLEKIHSFSKKLSSDDQENILNIHNACNLLENIKNREKIELNYNNLGDTLEIWTNFILALNYKYPEVKNCFRYIYHYSSYFIPRTKSLLGEINNNNEKLKTYVAGNLNITKHVDKITKNTTHAIKMVKEKNLHKDWTQYFVYKDYIASCEFDKTLIKINEKNLAKKDNSYFSSPEFASFYKYNYFPIKLTFEKNKAKADMLTEKIQRVELC